MRVRYFALVFGIVYVVVGLAGFVPGLMTHNDMPEMAIGALSGRLLGLFPVNAVHTLVHIVIGLWGIFAWRSFTASRTYAQSVAVIFAVLTIAGLIRGLNTLFGLVPLFGHDVWLHAGTTIIAAYFGFATQRGAVGTSSAVPR
jgi:hypothetical protein